MSRLFATVGVLALGFGVVAGEPAPAPAAAELVRQLDSDDYREREAAAAALEKAGPEAIPALTAAEKSDSPEVRQRAAALLVKLRRAATSAELLAAKKVRLNIKDEPLGAAVDTFRSQTGLHVALDPAPLGDPPRKVTCATGEVTVWEALDAFCAAAGLREEFRDELEPAKRQSPLGGYAGYAVPPAMAAEDAPITLTAGRPRRVVGDRRTAVRVLVLPPAFPGHRVTLGTGETTLCLDITPAPGLNSFDVSAVKVTKVIDAAGRVGSAGRPRPAEAAEEVLDWGGPGGGRPVVVFGAPGLNGRFDIRSSGLHPKPLPNPRVHPVPLKLATPHARSLRRLEGSVFAELVLTNIDTLVTVGDPAKHVGAAFDGPGGVRFTVVSLNNTDAGTRVQLLLECPSPWSVNARRGLNPGGIWPEAPQPGGSTPTPHALDAAGKPMRVAPTSFGATSGPGPDGQTMQYRYDWLIPKSAGAPAKFIVTGPRTAVVEIPFALDDVPLP